MYRVAIKSDIKTYKTLRENVSNIIFFLRHLEFGRECVEDATIAG